MESKKDIRKCVLEKRSQMTQEEWDEKSHKIFDKVVSHPFFFSAKTVCCYVDFRREVGTTNIIEEAWSRGKKVAVPKIEDGQMNFYYIESWQDVSEGYYGILEPNTTECLQDKTPLVIMPGAVFDRNRNRIGYGKGFYDRFLQVYSKSRTIALAFELQLVGAVPHEEHDIRPMVLITEEEIYVR